MQTRQIILLLFAASPLLADEKPRAFRELKRFPAAEAIQGVAVDENHAYAITNRAIGKYDKRTGKRVAKWVAPRDSKLRHLNGGVVLDGKLYAAHSNWPAKPLENSVEIWDAKTLRHLQSRPLPQKEAALTWIDRQDGQWWIVFAKYGTKAMVSGTTLHKLDEHWKSQQSWKFPAAVVKRFVPYSNSGGSWGPDGLLYATGHDRAETYVLRAPETGATLELVETVSVAIAGQGIAWDRSQRGVLYGIVRKRKEVTASRLSRP